MYVGHYAVSLALKKVDPNAKMSHLFVAVQLLDVAWSGLVLAGVEKVKYVPGFLPASPLNLYYMPFTHSLVGALLWSALAAVLYLVFSRRPQAERQKTALVLGTAVFSHWLLDVPVHAGDLPLVGNSLKIGLGLWHYPLATFLLEAGLLLGGLLVYLRAAGGRRTGMVLFSIPLLLINAANIFMPVPQMTETAFAVVALVSYLAFAWIGGRLDRPRPQAAR